LFPTSRSHNVLIGSQRDATQAKQINTKSKPMKITIRNQKTKKKEEKIYVRNKNKETEKRE